MKSFLRFKLKLVTLVTFCSIEFCSIELTHFCCFLCYSKIAFCSFQQFLEIIGGGGKVGGGLIHLPLPFPPSVCPFITTPAPYGGVSGGRCSVGGSQLEGCSGGFSGGFQVGEGWVQLGVNQMGGFSGEVSGGGVQKGPGGSMGRGTRETNIRGMEGNQSGKS